MQTIVWSHDVGAVVRSKKTVNDIKGDSNLQPSELKAIQAAFSGKNKELQQWWA
ncbi:MAG: hypothetical protein K0Q59_268 [Paenibacillus sp.]|jgi:hypothetical protein|nr:hypothetical protein [Paenibacillus sp.]